MNTTAIAIAPMGDQHADAVLDIYRLGIATGHATFETEPPTWDCFIATRMPDHRHVALDPCTPPAASVWSASGSASAAITASGATSY